MKRRTNALAEEQLKIRFVKEMKFCSLAMCLYWVNEIHVDESLKGSPVLDDIIRHEKKHYNIISKAIQSKGLKREVLFLYNSLWDMVSCFKIVLKHWRFFKTQLIVNLLWVAAGFLIAYVLF